MTSSRSSPASAPSPPPEHHRPPRHEEPGDPQPGSASRHRMLPTRRTEGWRRPNPDVAATSSAQIGEPLWGAIRALRSAGHSLAPVRSVFPSSCLGGAPTACAVRSAPSELVVPQYPSLVPPDVVDICDYELKLPVMPPVARFRPSHNQCKRDYCAVAHWFVQERCESRRQGRAGVEWSQ